MTTLLLAAILVVSSVTTAEIAAPGPGGGRWAPPGVQAAAGGGLSEEVGVSVTPSASAPGAIPEGAAVSVRPVTVTGTDGSAAKTLDPKLEDFQYRTLASLDPVILDVPVKNGQSATSEPTETPNFPETPPSTPHTSHSAPIPMTVLYRIEAMMRAENPDGLAMTVLPLDITMQANGSGSHSETFEVQPGGKVEVAIDMPIGMSGEYTAVWYIGEDGKLEKMPGRLAEKKGGQNDRLNLQYIFTTDHFSYYALVNMDSTYTGTAATLSSTPGQILTGGQVYTINGNLTIDGNSGHRNGLVVGGTSSSAPAVLWLPAGTTLTVIGGSGSNAATTGAAGRAAILLPENQYLFVRGTGRLVVEGGRGGNAGRGEDGEHYEYRKYTYYEKVLGIPIPLGDAIDTAAGNGGRGGNGAGGGGAGIGTNGGPGGIGGIGGGSERGGAVALYAAYATPIMKQLRRNGGHGDGGTGGAGISTGNAGTVHILDGVTLAGSGGTGGTNGAAGWSRMRTHRDNWLRIAYFNEWDFTRTVGSGADEDGILVLYAKWIKIYVDVKFDSNGRGTAPAPVIAGPEQLIGAMYMPSVFNLVLTDDTADPPVYEYVPEAVDPPWQRPADFDPSSFDPVAPSGYRFAGWHHDAATTQPWDWDEDRVPPDGTTLYAKWVRSSSSGGGGRGGSTPPGGPAEPDTAPPTGAGPGGTTPGDPEAEQPESPDGTPAPGTARVPQPGGADGEGGYSDTSINYTDQWQLGRFLRLFGIEFLVFAPLGEHSWSLVNLLLCAFGVILAVHVTVSAVRQKRRQTKERLKTLEKLDLEEQYMLEKQHQTDQRKLVWIVAADTLAIAGVFLFVLTQRFDGIPALLDYWTFIHLAVVCSQVVSVILMRRAKADADDSDYESLIENENDKGAADEK